MHSGVCVSNVLLSRLNVCVHHHRSIDKRNMNASFVKYYFSPLSVTLILEDHGVCFHYYSYLSYESFKRNVKFKSWVAYQSLLDLPSNKINKHVIMFPVQYVQFNEDI